MKVALCSRWMLALLALAVVLLSASVGNCEEPTITVSGDAEVRVVPDHVVITAGVESRAKTVAAASEENDGKIRGIVDFLKKSGIDDKHVRTEYIQIEPIIPDRPVYSKQGAGQQIGLQGEQESDPFDSNVEQDPQQPAGYLVSRQFAITIIDLKKFETIYRELIELGVNRVSGIDFRTTELRKHRDKARLDAVRAAREKAQAMASELGATLASIKTIHETGDGGGHGGHRMLNSISDPFGEPVDDAETFAAGQIAITASVEIVFVLGNTELKNE